MLTLLLAACAGDPEITIDDTGKGGKDSGEDSVDPIEDPTFTFAISGETSGRAMLIQYLSDPTTWDLGEAISTTALTGATLQVHLDDPPASAYIEQTDYEGTDLALASAAVWDDADGDLDQEFGENFVATDVVLLWIGGELVPDVFEIAGADFGWNAMSIASFSGELEVYDPTAVPVEIREPVESITLAGDFVGPAEDVGVVAAPFVMLGGGMVTAYLYDGQLTDGSFEVTFSGEPPSDHFSDDDGDGFGEAGEFLVSYEDVAQPGGYGVGDIPLYPACLDGEYVIAYWLEGFDDLARATSLGAYGFGAGWNVVSATEGGDPAIVKEADYTALTMSPDCAF